MEATKKGSDVFARGLVLAAMAVLLIPTVAAAADGPTVRITRLGVGRVALDLSDDTVTVRKEMTADRSVVTMTTAKEQVSMTVRRGVVTITGPGGTISVAGGFEGDEEKLFSALKGSEAATRARLLLARVKDGPETFVGQSMLLTRGILEMGTGSSDALNQHQEWVADQAVALARRPGAAPGKPMLIRTAWLASTQSRTPGECWDIYSLETLRIYNDLVACKDDLSWYEAHKLAGCMLIYAIRAEAAAVWFISCNGGALFTA